MTQQKPQTEQPQKDQAKNERSFRRVIEFFFPDSISVFNFFLVIATIALVVATILLFNSGEKGVQNTQDQLTLTFPPQLRITNVVIYRKGDVGNYTPPALKPGEEIEGFAYVVNSGRESAIIHEVVCMTYWRAGQLPMYRPYNDLPFNTAQPYSRGNCVLDLATEMKTGKFNKWSLSTTVPANYTADMFLYVLGYVIFHDRLGTRHAVMFARKYDPAEGRFVVVKDNPDYESVE